MNLSYSYGNHYIFSLRLNMSTSGDGVVASGPTQQTLNSLVQEAVLAFFLLLLLVWFLNHEFEVSYRLHYHGNVEADKHRSKIQSMRNQAEWLLGNIIPIHVADQLKVFAVFKTKKYQIIDVLFFVFQNTTVLGFSKSKACICYAFIEWRLENSFY